MMPSRVLLMIASFDDSTIAASRLDFLGPFLLGDVTGEGTSVDEPLALPQHAGVDQHVLDRVVLAAHLHS